MKCTTLASLFLFVLSSSFCLNAQEPINGIWNTGQDNTKIGITEKNETYEGKILSSDNTKAIIGNLFLKDVKSVGGKWKGKLYSPKRKEWFDAVFVVKGNQLLVTVESAWMSKTFQWTKE